jgi:hypothetical protein
VRSDCAKWLTEVEAALPSIVVKAIDAQGRDVAGVQLEIDGVLVDYAEGRAAVLDPGRRTLTVRAAGYDAQTESFVVRQGETNRIVTFTMKPATPSKPPPQSATQPEPDAPRSSSIPTASFVLGGDVDAAKTKLLAGDIALAGGLVALGAAVVIAIVAPSRATSTANGTRFHF